MHLLEKDEFHWNRVRNRVGNGVSQCHKGCSEFTGDELVRALRADQSMHQSKTQ
jgi:hypothetical protein